MRRLCQSRATQEYDVYSKEDLIEIALNYSKLPFEYKFEDIIKLKKSELCSLLPDLPKTIEELEEIENKLIEDTDLAFTNKEYKKIKQILFEASLKDYSNVVKYIIENYDFEDNKSIFKHLFIIAESYVNHDLIYFLIEHKPPAKTKKENNYYYNLLMKSYNYLFGSDSNKYELKPKVKITVKEEDKYHNQYFNVIAQELDVKSDNKYLLHIKDTSYTTIKIINKLNNEQHYNYTFNKDQIIDRGQGEYIITDNITYKKYLKCMDIIDSEFHNLRYRDSIDEVINATKCQMFFIPKTLYELFFVREYIKTITDKKHFWFINQKSSVENQINNHRFTLNNIIASELVEPTYQDLYNKLKELFNEIISIIDDLLNNIITDNPTKIPDAINNLQIVYDNFIDKKSFKNIILRAFKLECSPLASLGYILYRGSSVKKDIIMHYNKIYALSYGPSLFASLIYDNGVNLYSDAAAGAMAYNFMTKNKRDSYCIIVPFDEIDKCVFYIPPLTTIESLFGSGYIFHPRTKGDKSLKSSEIYIALRASTKYSDYLKENHPSVLTCTPKELAKEFKQYKNTLITFN